MLYINFVLWLTRKTYEFFTRFDPLTKNDTARYNRINEFDFYSPWMSNFAWGFASIIPFVFFGGPILGYFCLVMALPVPPHSQWIVLMGSGLLLLVVSGFFLLKHATKRH